MTISKTLSSSALYESRISRVRQEMQRRSIDAALLSVGHDLPYLTGYYAMPLERLTMLVVTRESVAALVVPRLEAPRVTPFDDVFRIVPWGETENPVSLVAKLLGGAKTIAVGDQMWARFLVELMGFVSNAKFVRAVDVVGPMRMAKDANEIEALRQEMQRRSIDAALLSVGHDLPYLTGYYAMPLERLTMLVVTHDSVAALVVPRLEAPRVTPFDDVFRIVPWGETENPVSIVAKLLGGAKTIAVGDQMWARFLVELMGFVSNAKFVRAVDVVGPMRMAKDANEIEALRLAGAAADRVAKQLQAGEIDLVGRTEAQVSADISARLLEQGHDVVNFAIVAAGENAASPHHHAGSRIIQKNEIVLCDFGGTMNGYCSDITRCVFVGTPSRKITSAYSVLHAAQAAGVKAGVVGATCESVDAAARRIIDDAGFGDFFIHRTGHGIGMEAHEEPYMVSGNKLPIAAGHAFSVEPGIYLPGKWGMRLEDIVVATDNGPLSMNSVDHSLVILN